MIAWYDMKVKKEISKRRTQQQTKRLSSVVTQSGNFAARKKEGTENIERRKDTAPKHGVLCGYGERFWPTETVVSRE